MAQTQVGIKLTLDGAQQVEQGVRRVVDSVGTIGSATRASAQQAIDATTSLKSAFLSMGGVVAAAFSVKAIVEMADSVTTLNNQLKLATGGAVAAGQAYQELFAIAQRSRVSFTELGGTFASISRAGAELGLSQQRLLGVTEAIGNAMTISSGSAASMNAALTQLGQGLASGTLRGEELNSVMEQTPRLAQALADGMGVSIGQLRELGAAGKITAEEVIKALESQSKTLAGEVSSSAMTVGQALTQLQNAAVKTVGDMDEVTGASGTLASALSGVATGIQTVGQFMRENEEAITITLGALGGAAVAAGILSVTSAITGAGGMVAAIASVKAAMVGLTAFMAANPVGLAVLGIATVGGAVMAMNKGPDLSKVDVQARELENTVKRLADAEALLDRAGGAGQGRMTAQLEARIDGLKKYRDQLSAGMTQDKAIAEAMQADEKQWTAAQRKANAEAEASAKQLQGIKNDLYKIDSKYIKTLQDLAEQRNAGNISEAEYVKLAKMAVDANASKEKSSTKLSAAVKAQAETEKEALKGLELYSNLIAETAGFQGDYAEKVSQLAKAYAKNKITLEEFTLAHEKLLAKQPAAVKATKMEAEARKVLTDAVMASARAYEEAQQAMDAQVQSLWQSMNAATQAGKDEAEALQFELGLMGKSADARTLEIEQNKIRIRLKRELAAIEATPFEDESQRLAARVQAEENAARDMANAGLKVQIEAQKTVESEWRKTSDQIQQSLTDALMRSFESGKDFAKTLRDTVVNMFKTMVLRPVISVIVNPIAGAVSGALGLPGATGGAGANAFGLVSNGASAYNAYTGLSSGQGFWGSVGSVFGMGSGTGAGAGATAVNGLSALQPVTIATNSSYVAPVVADGAAAGGWASTIQTAAIPVAVTAAVFNALGAFRSERRVGVGIRGTLGAGTLEPWEEWREGGTLIDGPSYNTGNPVAELKRARDQLEKFQAMGPDGQMYAAQQQMMVNSLELQYGHLEAAANAQSSALQTAYDALRKNVGDMADALGLGGDAVRQFTTQLGGSDKGLNFEGLSAEQQQAKIAEALATANNELAQQVLGRFEDYTETRLVTTGYNYGNSDSHDNSWTYNTEAVTKTERRYIPSEFARDGEEAIDTLTRLAGSLTLVNSAFDMLGLTMLQASLASGDYASQLVDAMGGGDAFAQAAGSFFENYYTEAEKAAYQTKLIAKELASAGLTMPKTRDEFRAMVEAQQALGPAGKDGLAALLRVNGAFANLVPAADEAAGGLQAFGEAITGYYDNFYTEGERAAMTTAQITKELAKVGVEMPKTREEFRALMDASVALGEEGQPTVNALLGVQEAFASLRPTMEDAASTIRDLYESELGRAPDQEGMSYWTDQVASGAMTMEQAVKAFGEAAKTESLNLRMLELSNPQRYTIEMRRRELSLLSPTNQALQQSIWYLEDVKAAQEERIDLEERLFAATATTAQIAERARNAIDPLNRSLYDMVIAAESAKQALADAKTATDGALSEVRRLIQDEVNRLQQTFSATDKALAAVDRAAAAQRTALQKQITDAKAAEAATKGIFDTVRAAARELRGQVSSTAAMQADQALALIRNAIATGVLPDQKVLDEAIGATRAGLEAQVYATAQDAEFAKLVLAGELEKLQDIAQPQLSAAEQAVILAEEQLAALEDQVKQAKAMVDGIRGVDGRVLTVSEAMAELQTATAAETIAREQIGKLELQLTEAQKQYDELRGIKTGVDAIAPALQALADAIAGEKSAAAQAAAMAAAAAAQRQAITAAAGGQYGASLEYVRDFGAGSAMADTSYANQREADIASLYQNVLGRTADSGGLAYYAGTAMSIAEIAASLEASREDDIRDAYGGAAQQAFNDQVNAALGLKSDIRIPGFATGGRYPGGLALVGEEGPELINFAQPGQVYTAPQTRALLGGMGGSERIASLMGEMAQEIRSLRAEVVELRRTADKGNEHTAVIAQAHEGRGQAPLLVEIAQ